jgi:hypothetical protein
MNFFVLPMNLRERWWGANTLAEREAVEEEFRETKSLEVPEPYRRDYKTMLNVMADFLWDSLTDGLRGDKGKEIGEAMRAYLEASDATDALKKEFEAHNEAWGIACVPNTDTKRVAEYWEGYGRLQGDIHYAEIHEYALYDELLLLIDELKFCNSIK